MNSFSKSIFIVAIVFACGCAWAGEFEDGMAAYEKNNYKTALIKFRKAAAQGFTQAQTSLGFMYAIGQGVAQDSQKLCAGSS